MILERVIRLFVGANAFERNMRLHRGASGCVAPFCHMGMRESILHEFFDLVLTVPDALVGFNVRQE